MPTFARSKPNSVTHCDGPAARPQRAGKPSHRQAEERPARQQRSTPLARTLLVAVRGYQVLLSPLFGGSCRYLPSCSHYMAEAVRRHGAVSGGWLGLCRLARCHPLGSSGFDPVPDQWPPARVACCSREDLPGASLDSGVALSPSSGVPGGRLR